MLRIHIYYHSINTMHTNPIKDLHLDCPSSFSMSLLWPRQCLSTGCDISMSTIGPKGKTIIVFRNIEYLKYDKYPRICFIEDIHILEFQFQNASISDNETRNILKEDIPNLISYLLVVPGNYFKFDEITFSC